MPTARLLMFLLLQFLADICCIMGNWGRTSPPSLPRHSVRSLLVYSGCDPSVVPSDRPSVPTTVKQFHALSRNTQKFPLTCVPVCNPGPKEASELFSHSPLSKGSNGVSVS